MCSLQEVRNAWNDFTAYETISDLKDAIWNADDQPLFVINLRSLCWKSFLLFQNLDRASWPSVLNDSRSAYTSLRDHFLRSVEIPEELDSTIDPLSDDNESPWNTLRNDEILREDIFQDVERCMPENPYFRQSKTQKMLLDILFVWCKLNPDVGYRQGMHEVLAPIVWVMERDAIAPVGADPVESGLDDEEKLLHSLLDGRHIEHDAFTLFGLVMQTAKSFYEPGSLEPQSTKDASKPQVERESPMLKRSQLIFQDILPKVDPELSAHLEKIDIMPQIFLMRWVRLIFGREFPFDDVLQMWDLLIANSVNLDLVDTTCVAMMLRIRWQLIDADTNEALTLLLRYPGVSPHHPRGLVQDALQIKENPTVATGHGLITKYTTRQPAAATQAKSRLSAPIKHKRTRTPLNSPSPAAIESLLQDAARGVINRSEKWGLNQAVRDVVGEVRKNVQGLQSGQVSPQTKGTHSRTNSVQRISGTEASSTIAANVLRRINALEERNKQLARLLEGTVKDMWKIQKDLSESQPPPVDEATLTSLSVGVAKVQFVQAFLEDITLPLPEDLVPHEMEKTPKTETNEDPDESIHTALSETAKILNPRPPSELIEESNTAVRSRSKPAGTPKSLESPSTSPSASKPTPRPRLTESSFSWMLSQDKNDSSSFSRASPFSPNEKRYQASLVGQDKGYLFGDEGDGQKSRRKSRGNQKGQPKSRPGVLVGEEIDLGDLSSNESREG